MNYFRVYLLKCEITLPSRIWGYYMIDVLTIETIGIHIHSTMDGEDNLSDSMNTSVSNFSQHLVLIEEQLLSDPQNESLLSLKNDILHFLQIAKAQSSDIPATNPAHADSSPCASNSSNSNLVIGANCSIPYSCYTGDVIRMNCVIMELNHRDSSAVVLFTHPTHLSMVPCEHFLEGRCRFGDECRYNHGHKVDIQLIEAYEESDLSQAKQDSSCIVYKEDEKIWMPGVIMSIAEDRCDVWVDRLNEKIDVEIKDIFVFKDDPNVEFHSSGEESDVEIRTISSLPTKEEEVSKSEASSLREASWEKHTRGIGSKLLNKMGYVPGTGLGVESQGRRDPIEIVVLPKGRGLDKCMEVRKNVGIPNIAQKGRSSNHSKKYTMKHRQVSNRSDDSTNLDVFDFLNESMQLQQLVHEEKEMRESGIMESGSKRVDTSQSRRIRLDKQLRDAKGEVDTLKSSLSRNKKDPVIAKQIEIKLKRAEKDLSRLQREEGSILDKLSSKKQRTNMSVF